MFDTACDFGETTVRGLWVVSSWNGLGAGKQETSQGQEEANMIGTIII